MGIVAEHLLQSVRYPTWCTADAAGKIEEQRVPGIHWNVPPGQLVPQFSGRSGIAKEQQL